MVTPLTIRSSTGEVQTLQTTHEHPLFVPGRGWVATRELQPGDALQEPSGAFSTVTAARRERHPGGIKVYNFRVAQSETYFVREKDSTAEPVWVHNAYYRVDGPNKVALGFSDSIDEFAQANNAVTWKQIAGVDPNNWKNLMLEALGNPSNEILFNLTGGVDAEAGALRAAAGRGGPTDWELLQIYNNRQWWDRITWINNGVPVPNPFAV